MELGFCEINVQISDLTSRTTDTLLSSHPVPALANSLKCLRGSDEGGLVLDGGGKFGFYSRLANNVQRAAVNII